MTSVVATPIVAAFKTDQISVTNPGPGQFTIYVLDPPPAPGLFVDDSFTGIARERWNGSRARMRTEYRT